jgi:hypothetical protein
MLDRLSYSWTCPNLPRARQPCKSRPESLGIWNITAMYQKAEPHDVARESRCDNARANVVADIAAPTNERPLLRRSCRARRPAENRRGAGADRQVRRCHRDRVSPPSPLRAPAREDRATPANPAVHRLECPTIPHPRPQGVRLDPQAAGRRPSASASGAFASASLMRVGPSRCAMMTASSRA